MKTTTIASLAGLLWALSFFLSLGTIVPLEIERLACVLIGLFSLTPLVFCGTTLAQKTMVAPRIGFLILLFWLLAVISCAWSVAPPISLVYLGAFSLLPATVLALLLSDTSLRQAFLKSAGIGAGLVVTGLAVWALVQIFWIPEMLVNTQVRNPFANPNAFAGLLGLAFFTGLGFYLKETRRVQRIILFVAIFLILSALIAMASRAASLTLLIGVVILLSQGGFRGRWKPIALLMVGVAAIQAFIAFLPGRATLGRQIADFATDAISAQNRVDIWHATADLIAAHPLLGTGYRTFSLMYPSVRLPSDIYSGGFMAHSDPLQFWAEIGVLGPILFYATGLLTLLCFFKFWRVRNKTETARNAYSLALFIGCGGFIAHTHVDFLFYAVPMIMVFALALAVLLCEVSEKAAQPFSFMARWPRSVADAAIALPVLALMGVFTPLMLGEYYTVQANRAIESGSMQELGAAINAANESGFGLNDRPYLLAAAVPLGILQAQPLPRAEQEKLFHQIDRLLTKALQRNTRLSAAWHQRGVMMRVIDPTIPPKNYPDAETCFKKALAINPLYLLSRTALADLYESRGESGAALNILADGVHWPYLGEKALAYYDRTEKLARALHRDDLIAGIEKGQQTQQMRLEVARNRAQAILDAGLSTAN